MKIEGFQLENVGPFSSLAVALAPTETAQSNVTVLIGNNGAGKTTVLKALATSLSWFVARLRSEKGSGSPIDEEQIYNGASSAAISLTARNRDTRYEWIVAKVRAGRKARHASQLNNATRLADAYRTALSENE